MQLQEVNQGWRGVMEHRYEEQLYTHEVKKYSKGLSPQSQQFKKHLHFLFT